jgi:uncharacterized protein YcbK (DUF882 family)
MYFPRKRGFVFLLIAGLIFFALPLGVLFAQGLFPGDLGPRGLVPCGDVDAGEPSCQACHVTDLLSEAGRFILFISVFAATLMIAYAGWVYLTAQGSEEKVKKAHGIFRSVVIGLIFILLAGFIVKGLIQVLTGHDLDVIGRIDCVPQPRPGDFPNQSTGGQGTGSSQGGGVGVGSGNIPGAVVTDTQVCFNNNQTCLNRVNVPGARSSTVYFDLTGLTQAQLNQLYLTQNITVGMVASLQSRPGQTYAAIDPTLPGHLQDVWNRLGPFTVTSGYRSDAYNAGLASQSRNVAQDSQHRHGTAADIAVTSTNSCQSIVSACSGAGATHIQTYATSRHVHCDWRAGAQRPVPTCP